MIEKLLKLLAAREDEDIDVVSLALKLRPSQAEVVAAIARLIADARIDAATLRPPVARADEEASAPDEAGETPPDRAAPAPEEEAAPCDERAAPLGDRRLPENNLGAGRRMSDEPSRPLFDALAAEGKRRGLSLENVSRAVFDGNRSRIYFLKDGFARRATAEKVRAWLAACELDPPKRSSSRKVIPAAMRKARPYCRHPDACTAKVKGKCPRCPKPSAATQLAPSGANLAAVTDRARETAARMAQSSAKRNTAEARKLLATDPEATKGRNGGVTQAMTALREMAAAEERQSNPLERAKLALQRKGRVVHGAELHGGKRGYFMVGGERDPRTGRLKELAPAELIDLAERKTG